MTWIVLASLALEAAVGYPAALHARVPHPVVWAGNAIGALERWWNRPAYSFARRRLLGFVAVGLYYIVRKGILDWSTDKADL